VETAVLLVTVALRCGHSKTIKRKVEDEMPTTGSLVNCVGCTDTADSGRIVLTPVTAVEIFGAGLE
jgi:hypothetical protein